MVPASLICSLGLRVAPFSQGTAAVVRLYPVQREGKFGYIDGKGRTVIAPRFTDAWPFREGLACVQTEASGGYGYIDASGTLAIRPGSTEPAPFSGGLARLRTPKGVGFIDVHGDVAIEPTFLEARDFSEGRAAVRGKAGWGYVDATGRLISPPTFLSASSFFEGHGLVETRDGFRSIDASGALSGPEVYRLALAFRFGAEPIVQEVNGSPKRVFLDRQGRRAFPAAFEDAKPFERGFAPVRIGTRWTLIDPQGKVRFKPRFGSVRVLDDTMVEATDAFGMPVYATLAGDLVARKTDLRPPLDFGSRGADGGNDLVDVELSSSPSHCSVYFIPLFDYEDNPSMLNDERKLAPYKVPDGATNTKTWTQEMRYVVLFVSPSGKRQRVDLDVRRGKPNRASVSFP